VLVGIHGVNITMIISKYLESHTKAIGQMEGILIHGKHDSTSNLALDHLVVNPVQDTIHKN